MKVIIAGGRDFNNKVFFLESMKEVEWHITHVVSGMASGADTLAVEYANENNLELAQFWAEWNFYGRSAGPIRNRQMAKFADALVAFWDGKSRGTKNMIDTMIELKKPVKVILYDKEMK